MNILAIAIGGSLGALCRYGIYRLVQSGWMYKSIPITSFTVNVLGCLIVGMAYAYFLQNQTHDSYIRDFIIVGILGSFTTFSAFTIEFFEIASRQSLYLGLAFIFISLLCSIIAFLVGVKFMEMIVC